MSNLVEDDPCGPGKFVAPVRSIALRTEIPGPKSRVALARRSALMGADLPPNIVVGQAHGARVIDLDNNVFIDFASGTDGLGMGHTHEQIVSAVQSAVERYDVMPPHATDERQFRLVTLLCELMPHGVVTKARLFSQPEQALAALGVDREIALTEPVTLAGVATSTSAAANSAHWLISDERHLNIGRLGAYNAAQAVGMQPDLTLVNLRAGAALVALVGRGDIIDDMPVHDDPVHPLAVTAALAGLMLVQEQNLAARGCQLADLLRDQTAVWTFPALAQVRQIGALFVLKLRSASLAQQLVESALQRGLLLRTADSDPACVPLLYPLMVPEEQFYEGLDVLEAALAEISHGEDHG